MSHYDCKECHQDPVSGHAPDCTRGKAMDELIAGDADLYDVRMGALREAADVVLHSLACSICLEINHCKCDTSQSWAAGPCQPPTDKLAEAILELGNHPIASARIKGDKDRLASRAPPPVAWLYDFTGFRAAYVRKHDDLVEKGYLETPLYAHPAQGIEAGTAETGTGSVHESPVPTGDAPDA